MTSTTLKALIDVYGTLITAGWGEPDDQGAKPMAPDHETPERPPEVEQSMELRASHSSLGTQKYEATI
jgi:hypothetical protein